jgi:hypothetical protein
MEIIGSLAGLLNANAGIAVVIGFVIIWVYFNYKENELLKGRLEFKTDEAKDWERKAKIAEEKHKAIFKTKIEQEKIIKTQEMAIKNLDKLARKFAEDLAVMKNAKINEPFSVSGATEYSGVLRSLSDYLGNDNTLLK